MKEINSEEFVVVVVCFSSFVLCYSNMISDWLCKIASEMHMLFLLSSRYDVEITMFFLISKLMEMMVRSLHWIISYLHIILLFLAGRIVFELFSDVCPKTCENFRCLCIGNFIKLFLFSVISISSRYKRS